MPCSGGVHHLSGPDKSKGMKKNEQAAKDDQETMLKVGQSGEKTECCTCGVCCMVNETQDGTTGIARTESQRDLRRELATRSRRVTGCVNARRK